MMSDDEGVFKPGDLVEIPNEDLTCLIRGWFLVVYVDKVWTEKTFREYGITVASFCTVLDSKGHILQRLLLRHDYYRLSFSD